MNTEFGNDILFNLHNTFFYNCLVNLTDFTEFHLLQITYVPFIGRKIVHSCNSNKF